MRNIEKKGIGVLMLAVVNVACDSSLQDNESVTSPVIAAEPSAEVTTVPEESQPANSNAETTITGFDSPTTSQPNLTYDSDSTDTNTTPSVAETPTDSGPPAVSETPSENETLSVAETPTDNATLSVTEPPPENETPSVAETPTDNATLSVTEPPPENETPSVAETPTDSATLSVTETPPENETPSAAETPTTNNENPTVNETQSVTETPSPPETNADAIIDNTADNLTDTNSVGSTSYESVSTNGGTSASASASATVSLDLSNLPDTTTTVFGNTDDNYCAEVGDIFDINISGSLANNGTELSAVSLNSYSTIDLENHPNVQLVSQSDESIAVAVTTSDIVDLIVRYEHQTDLIYLSAATPNIPKPFILKNEYQDGNCSFALYTDSGCAVLASDINMVTATVGDTSINAQGCTLGNPEQLPVIDLQE